MSVTHDGQITTEKEHSPLITAEAVGWGYRHLVAFLLFLGFVMCYAMRVNLSVALVAMVNTTDEHETPASFLTGEFAWSPEVQGLILSSFFYGYITTQLLGGWMAERVGAKKVFGFGIFMTSVLTLLTPVAARTSEYLLIALRVLEGMAEGCTPAALFVMLSRWSPTYESSKLGAFVLAGCEIGTVVSQPISGLLCDYGFDGGWPSVFYVFGGLGVVWTILWVFLIYDSPDVDPRISEKERDYILSSRGRTNSQKHTTPWGSIFTSLPIFAICVANFSRNWGYYTLLTTLPSYLKQVLKFDTSENGLVAALPYLCMGLIANAGGQVADALRSNKILSTISVRKLNTGLGLILPAVFLASAGYVGCNRVAAVVVVTMATGLLGIATSGYLVNHLDIAPHNAGAVWGIVNTVGNIPGMVAPEVVQFITHGESDPTRWRPVFFLSSGLYVMGAVFFMLFASGEQQEWDLQSCDQEVTIETKTIEIDKLPP